MINSKKVHHIMGDNLVFCVRYENNPNLIGNIQTSSGISDHDIVTFEINGNPRSTPKPSHIVFVYSKTNTEKLINDIDKAKQNFFSSNPQNRNIEENWQ